MIALLLLLAVLTTVEALALRRKAPVGPRRVGMQTRIVELQAAAMDTVGRPWRLTDPRHDLGPWDHATLAILLAEKERLAEADSHVALAPAEFQPWWRAAYQNEPYPPGDMPSSLKPGLARGYAYFRLHAKLAEARGVDPSPFEDQAQAWARLRSVALVLGGFAGLALVMVGLGSLVFLLVTRRKGPPPEDCPMTWRGAALAFLGWFVALRFSGTAAAIIFKVLPLPKALALPLALGIHMAVGALLLLKARGQGLRETWRAMTPGPWWKALGWTLVFLSVALVGVLTVGWITQPFLRHTTPPQQELWDLVSGEHGGASVVALFVSMAVMAPLFEEWMFRGALLPWLGHRLQPRAPRAAWPLAIVLSGLLFGLMHLQPAALPTLCTLGMVLGWALLRTRTLWTAVILHALWNGSVFLFMRMLA